MSCSKVSCLSIEVYIQLNYHQGFRFQNETFGEHDFTQITHDTHQLFIPEVLKL